MACRLLVSRVALACLGLALVVLWSFLRLSCLFLGFCFLFFFFFSLFPLLLSRVQRAEEARQQARARLEHVQGAGLIGLKRPADDSAELTGAFTADETDSGDLSMSLGSGSLSPGSSFGSPGMEGDDW